MLVESAELKPQLSMSDENDERLIIIKCHDENIVRRRDFV